MKFKLKLRQITLVSFLVVVAIMVISAAINYVSHRKMIIANFTNKYIEEIQQAREFYRLKFDKLQHDFIVMESRNIEKLEQLHAIEKREKGRFDIVKAAEELNKNTQFGSYQAFLIDRNYTIVRSSYPKDLGYNLRQHRVLVDIFDSVFNEEKGIDISPIQIDSASMQFKRYLLKLSDDRKHLLQIAFVLDLDELNKGPISALAGRKSLDLHLANDNLIQPVEHKPVNQEKNSLAHGWEQTKNFLTEMSENLNFHGQHRISALLKSDIAIDRVHINKELSSLFADEKIIHHLDLTKGIFAVYSITNGLFNKGTETKLLLRAHYSTEQIEQDLQSAFHHFFAPLILSLLILSISYLFIVRNILSPLLRIMSDFRENRRSECGESIVTEISQLRENYNQLHDRLNSEISKNIELLKINRRTIADTIHEIKTPLTNIMMNGEMIKKSKAGDTLSHYIDRLDSSINTISNSYENLAYAITHDNMKYPPTMISLKDMVKNRIVFFTIISEVNHKILNYLPEINGDPLTLINEIELERIIDNNLSNAIKYGELHQPITVRLFRTGNIATLEFASFGKEILGKESVFDEGYRENSGKRGLGLGLSMVKGICDKYDIGHSLSYTNGQNIFSYHFPTK